MRKLATSLALLLLLAGLYVLVSRPAAAVLLPGGAAGAALHREVYFCAFYNDKVQSSLNGETIGNGVGFATSETGAHWRLLNVVPTYSGLQALSDPNVIAEACAMRDPAVWFGSDGWAYMAYTAFGGESELYATGISVGLIGWFGEPCFGLVRSTDLRHWELVGRISPTPEDPNSPWVLWAPQFVSWPDGPHILFTAIEDYYRVADGPIYHCMETHPVGGDLTSWSTPVEVTATDPNNFADFAIDYFCWYEAGTYTMYAQWAPDAGTRVIRILQSSSALSGYELLTVWDPNVPATSKHENPSLVKLATGSYRIYIDTDVAGLACTPAYSTGTSVTAFSNVASAVAREGKTPLWSEEIAYGYQPLTRMKGQEVQLVSDPAWIAVIEGAGRIAQGLEYVANFSGSQDPNGTYTLVGSTTLGLRLTLPLGAWRLSGWLHLEAQGATLTTQTISARFHKVSPVEATVDPRVTTRSLGSMTTTTLQFPRLELLSAPFWADEPGSVVDLQVTISAAPAAGAIKITAGQLRAVPLQASGADPGGALGTGSGQPTVPQHIRPGG